MERAHPDAWDPATTFFEPSERIRRIRGEVISTPRSICLERPRLLERFESTRQGREAQREHPLVRRALALAYVMSHRRPRVWADELILGNMTSKRVAANYYPEGGSVHILEDLHRLDRRPNPFQLEPEERRELLRLGLRGVAGSVGGRALLRPGRISHFFDFFKARQYFITEEAGIGHQVPGYGEVVSRGLRLADQVARRRLETNALANGSPLIPAQVAFYRALRITLGGLREMASNLAREAERLALSQGVTPERRAELIRAAAACRAVPWNPASSFQEGLQACWLVHLGLNQEDFEQGMSFGRLDQILWHLYRRDLELGRLGPAEAVEQIASFQLKTCETLPLYSERIDQYFSGNGVAQGITLGGTDAAGRDATNELSGLFLDGYAQIRTREPALHVRVHDDSPRWFLDRAAQVVQLGCGKPSFFGDEALVRALEGAGMTTAHARDYAIIGCVETASQGRTYNSSDAALFNLALCLELALNGGRPLDSSRFAPRLGAATPPASRLRSFDEVVDAYRAQVRHALAAMAEVIGWLEVAYRELRPTSLLSALTRGTLESGRDVTWGGALYDLTSIQAVGLADVGDSLYALDRLVFGEGRLTLPQLVKVLRQDFAGDELLRAELVSRFPRFGNDDSEVDAMTQLAADVFAEEVRVRRNSRGGRWVPGFYSMTCHQAFGKLTGALPDGRRAGTRLSNGLSPVDGADRSGPTAVLRSAASLDSGRWTNCYALNLKFHAGSVTGRAGRAALASMVQTFLASQGGMQVQINVLDAETLRQAKADPMAFPGMVVRVAGYCAYFNDLLPEVQDEIIERTAHGLG
jgi:formate C-acetyltransferase